MSANQSARARLSVTVRAVAAAVSIGLALVSCSALGPGGSSSGGPGPSSPPGSPPAGSPSPRGSRGPSFGPDQIAHLTGATDLVLRLDEEGGFMAPGFLATQGPNFSLYGDGTVIFRDTATNAPEPVGNVSPQVPYQIARLTEEQIQSLLQFAIGPGGLGVAKAQYMQPIADAPTSLFTLTANGTTKTVSVNGLGIDVQAGPDHAVLTQLAALKTRLLGFGGDIVGEQVWSPDRYRGILTQEESGPPVAWPWPDIGPSDFVQHNGPTDPPFPIRTMTPAEVAVLKIDHPEGGVQGISLKGPEGKTYALRLRPLLPDEAF